MVRKVLGFSLQGWGTLTQGPGGSREGRGNPKAEAARKTVLAENFAKKKRKENVVLRCWSLVHIFPNPSESPRAGSQLNSSEQAGPSPRCVHLDPSS